MGARFWLAREVAAAASWVLRCVFRRPAANFPGKVGIYVDPKLIDDLSHRANSESVVIVGTNGKTTVSNLLADAFEADGRKVACNRTGANLDSGVATALLRGKSADWDVIECDELWLAKVVPQLRPRYVVLLNLFRDQLDRMGEINHIQASVVDALTSSPDTVLFYNCDDPLCQAIADRVANECVSFGIDESLGLAQNTVSDADICQHCGAALEYRWRQYGQLGAYSCPLCGFARAEPAYAGWDAELSAEGTSLSIRIGERTVRANIQLPGAYMAYNLLAVCAIADACDVSPCAVRQALQTFAPDNGRLQHYDIGGSRILLNLAKNPTGFNQNLRIVEADQGPAAVAFFINDKEADGHDVSWLWDVDFQELASRDDLLAFAGGMRRNDMQVRLKYAGIDAPLVDGAQDFLAKAREACPEADLYLIANYTALPDVKTELDHMSHSAESTRLQAEGNAHVPRLDSEISSNATPYLSTPQSCSCLRGHKLVIAHLYPELLNLYGDGGNVTILAERGRRRGIDVEIMRVEAGQKLDLAQTDIVFLGGGPDFEQRLASQELLAQGEQLRAYVEADGVLLAICGGYQILGHEWLLGEETVAGLGIVGVTTKRAEGGSHNRLVGNIALESSLASMPVIGYENHAGRTFLDEGCRPFGHVIGSHGNGNNDMDRADGVLYHNVVGTYLHGPLLAKNPEIADHLIERALARQACEKGWEAPSLPPLDDAAEKAANAFMCRRMSIRHR